MTGLFKKDFALLATKNLKRSLVIYAVCLCAFLFGFRLAGFLYFAIYFWTNLALSTIYYDQEHKGMLYLFTLPANARDYVVEKTLFSAGISWLILLIICVVMAAAGIDLEMVLLLFSGGMLVGTLGTAANIPAYLYFGYENARMASILTMAFFMGILFGLQSVDAAWLAALSLWAITPVIFLACLALTAGSAYLSIRILKSKDF